MISVGDIVAPTRKGRRALAILGTSMAPLFRVVASLPARTYGRKCYLVESADRGLVAYVWAFHVKRANYLEVDGAMKSMEQLCEPLGIAVSTLKERIKCGWSMADALTLKNRKRPMPKVTE